MPGRELPRGANAELTREVPGLSGVVLGVAWDVGAEATLEDNLVVAALLLDAGKKALSDDHFVFFNQLQSPDLSVTEMETVLGDDAHQVEVDLPAVPAEVASVLVALYVNDSPGRRRNLGQLRALRLRVLNLAGNAELIRSENLANGLDNQMAMVVGELYRHGDGWKVRIIGQGYSAGLKGLAEAFGVHL